MRWEACNSTLMAVCSSLLQLAASLSAHHECIIVLLSAQLLGVPSLVPGVFLSSSFRARACLMRPSHDLDSGVRSAAVAHVLGRNE